MWYRASYNGHFILYRCGALRSGCQLIPTKLSLLFSQRKGNSPVSLNPTFLGLLSSLYVSQIYRGHPELSADLEEACGCQGKVGL
jgi:hypothetical protein